MNPPFAFGLWLAFPAVMVAQTAAAGKPSLSGMKHSVCAVVSPAPANTECVKPGRSEPFKPDESPMPKYPEEAKAAHVEGDVTFHLVVGSGCAPEEITIDDGPKLLRESVENAVKDWKYCGVPEGQEIHAAIEFHLNCPGK
jgi:outer membrane biosynthesis protein TonB